MMSPRTRAKRVQHDKEGRAQHGRRGDQRATRPEIAIGTASRL
jgi:hypothetical protein